MKTPSLCLLALLFATYACKKGDSTDDNTNPPTTYQPTAAFGLSQYGTADLFDLNVNTYNDATASIKDAEPLISFTYEILGSNGMKTTADVPVKGTWTTDGSGKATIYAPSLFRYKDGTLTISIRFSNATDKIITATTKKEEFMIRNYKDLLAISKLKGASPSDTYVQTQNIAFPDSILTAPPINYFTANYDGQGYKITNVTVTRPVNPNVTFELVGFFGEIAKQATVKNIKLELSDAGFTTPNHGMCGGIAAVNHGTILNCSVKGLIKGASMSQIGGLTGETLGGRLIGCSFIGTLDGYRVGGLASKLDSSYVNMCYSNYSVTTTVSGGLAGWFQAHQHGNTRDTVYNSYVYIKQATVSDKLYSLFFTPDPAKVPVLYDGCYSNAGIAQTKTISYSTFVELNTKLLPLQVSNLPADITAPPANKPFKNTGDLSQPPVLWWE